MEKRIILLIPMVLLCLKLMHAQCPGGIPNPIIWEIFGDERNPIDDKFNFNGYETILSSNFLDDIYLERIDKLSLFIVFSDNKSNQIATLYNGSQETQILYDKVVVEEDLLFESLISKRKILSFVKKLKSNSGQKEPFLKLGGELNKSESSLSIAEIIIYDRLLSREFVDQVETYLSIKYGISLPASSWLIDSKGFELIKAGDRDDFWHRLTGIGKDINSGLEQLHSKNRDCELGFSIRSNSFKKEHDQNYLFWSDDNGELEFEESDQGMFQRSWFIEHIGHLDFTDLEITLDLSAIESDQLYNFYLLIDSPDDENKIPLQYDQVNGIYRSFYSYDINGSGSDLVELIRVPKTSRVLDLVIDDWKVSPNPLLEGQVYTISGNSPETQLTIQIFNGIGQMIERKSLRNINSEFETQFKALYAGVYSAILTGDNSRSEKQFIVLD